MKHNILTAHKVIGTIVGIIVFLLLFKYVAIPAGVPNTKITLAPAWLALITAIFGPIAGAVVAFIGHTLNDGLASGTVWWTWAIADGMFGLFLGLATQRIGLFIGSLTARKLVLFNVWQLIANGVAWLVIAPLGDHWIYGLALSESYQQGVVAALANTVVIAVLGTALITVYNRYFVKQN